ncbi:MAG: efflux transporter outer membrane subunit [Bdellovibrionales bacterium]
MGMLGERHWSNGIVFIAIFSLLSGCAIQPDLGQAPETRAVESYQTEESFGASDLTGWPVEGWWHAYGDAQLTRLIDLALEQSPTLAQAQARVRQAQASVGQSESALYPNISGNGSYTKLRQSENLGVPLPTGYNDTAATTLDMNFQLDFWGKNRSLVAAAVSNAVAVELEQAQARLIVSTSVASAYAELAHLYANLDAAMDALLVRQKTADLIQKRQRNGLENLGSYEQELAAAASTEAEIEAIKEQVALAKNRLAALIGSGPDLALHLERPDIHELQAFGLPQNLPADLLGRRPDIAASRLRAQAAAKRIDAASASFYPNVNLVGSVGQSVLGLGHFATGASLIAAVGPSVSLPIFDGGLLRSQYRQSRAEYDEAVATYDATLQQALHEVADVVTSENMLAPRLNKTTAALVASEKAYEVIHNRYKGGLAAYLDVLRSEDALIASRRALADLKTRSFTLDVALVRALGGGFALEGNVNKQGE